MDEQELAWMEESHAGCTSDTCDAVALLAEVRRLRAAPPTWTADRDCTILGLLVRLPDGTEAVLPVP